MRQAKEEQEVRDMFDKVLDSLSYEEVPRCVCPIKTLPHTMSTVFCNTKCRTPCYGFMEFQFITDRCEVINCDHEQPCSSCLDKIADYKVLMKTIKAILSRRFNTDKIRHRTKMYNEQSNKKINHLNKRKRKIREAREERNG